MRPPARRRRQNPITSGQITPINFKPVLDYAADVAAWDGVAEVGGAVKAQRAVEGGAVEPEELVAVGNATWVFLVRELQLGGLGFDGVSVLFEFGDCFLCVVDFEDAIDLANRSLFLEPAGLEDDLHYVLARVLWTQLGNCCLMKCRKDKRLRISGA